ncbi:MAG: osmosensitive channel signal transduction histidine kinase [Myxococcaceae bacterium]|nr:osmosensitive channel signal transduction histidine kinase [Myxococcaceae bacterium]
MPVDPRPDPDALLRRLHAEQERGRRAKLKIFFGFAPGVGKTFRMLQVARELAAQGVDVVVGLVETHQRSETQALLAGLEIVPRKQLSHRGRTLEEFDLDAALLRKPALIVVDELAHRNAEGSRHGKRWQDVLELLEAGCDVFTTVNVQHIESLNDVIAQITQVQVRETIPDGALERADEIELIDISPEQLLVRLREGKVYLPDQAARAAKHFFQRGNLLALRELALRQAAAHVESDVQEYREEHGVERPWATSERVLVSVGPSPASARLVRAARRMAAGLRAPWVAAYVEATGLPPLNARAHARLESNLRLAESLGATVVRLTGVEVAAPLLAYSRRHNVTRLVIGKPTHARLLDRLRGSLLDKVVRASGELDVHVLSGDSQADPNTERASTRDSDAALAGARAVFSPRSYLLALLLLALTSALALFVRTLFPVPDVEMLYLLAVMIAASQLGRGPSIFVAAMSVAAYDFFFVPPTHTFAVQDARYLLSFIMLFVVGFSLSALTGRLRRQERDALAREERASALYSLSRSLGALLEPSRAAEVVAHHAADVFDAAAVVLTPDAEGALRVIGAFPKSAELGPTELGVAKWVFEHGRLAGLGTDTLPGSKTVCAALRVGPESIGALALAPRGGAALDTDQRSFFEAFAQQAAFAFERARLSERAHQSALHARTEELRSSLLSAVSHDLRTPLASITGAATSLRDDPHLSALTRADLLGSICDETERLERLVVNLLDMTRLESGGLSPKRDWVPLDELLGAALTRLEHQLGKRLIVTRIDPEVPLLSVDPVLMQQVFVNLLENAAKYTPVDTPLELTGKRLDGLICIDVADRGPGLGGDQERIFEKFFRGAKSGAVGAGLGLAICRGIVEAHGGTLSAEDRVGGGAMFRIRLPAPTGLPTAEADVPA